MSQLESIPESELCFLESADSVDLTICESQTGSTVPDGAATCSEGFVICFLTVPLACLGSIAVAIHPCRTLRKHFTKPLYTKASYQVAAADCPCPFFENCHKFEIRNKG